MSLVPIGSQKGDSPKTPTLRQYWSQKQGKVPVCSVVKIIFLPNKAPNYTLVAEHGFRVSVLEDNPIHGIISDSLEEWSQEDVVLTIRIDNGEKGYWSLCSDTNESATWNKKDWGYKITLNEKTQTRTKTKAVRP